MAEEPENLIPVDLGRTDRKLDRVVGEARNLEHRVTSDAPGVRGDDAGFIKTHGPLRPSGCPLT